MKYLVTGGAGFIGSHLVDRLLFEGNNVVCLDNFDPFYSSQIKRQNIFLALQHPNFAFIEGDIQDQGIVKSIFSQHEIDVVVHLAARAGVRPSLLDPIGYIEVNIHGTTVLLEAMRDSNVKKMIFASSSSIYGDAPRTPFSESDNVDFPISPYAATKKAGELICHFYHYAYDFDIYCLRFFTVYGPRQRPEMAIHKFTRAIREGKPISVYGDGSSYRDYTYIDDIIDGIIKSIKKLRGYEILNLGESRTTSLIDLIKLIENAIGKKAILEFHPRQSGDVLVTFAAIDKAKQLIGYNPQVPIHTGIVKFIEWFNSRL